MRRILLVFTLMVLVTVPCLAVTLELASVREVGHPTILADETMAKSLEYMTDGAFTLSIGAAGRFYGDENGIVDALVRGDVAMGHVSVRALSQRVPVLDILSLPFLFNGTEHLEAALFGEIGDSLIESIEAAVPEVIVLGWYDCGGRFFYTRRQIASPFDMPGLTLCAEDTQAMRNYLEAMGAKYQWLARHSVYSAILQEVIEGAENDLISLIMLGDYDGARYILLDRHTFAPEVLLMCRSVYERLDESVQEQLVSAAATAQLNEWMMVSQKEADAIRMLKEMGCSLTYTDNGVREAFVRCAREPSHALGNRSVYDLTGSSYQELTGKIRELGEKYPVRDTIQ